MGNDPVNENDPTGTQRERFREYAEKVIRDSLERGDELGHLREKLKQKQKGYDKDLDPEWRKQIEKDDLDHIDEVEKKLKEAKGKLDPIKDYFEKTKNQSDREWYRQVQSDVLSGDD